MPWLLTLGLECSSPDLADSAYAREKVSAALREATANHEVGSDDWYATLADGYIDYLMKRGELQYNMPREEMRASAMEADRQVIAASLKEAIGENAKWLNDRNLRGISVVWSGSLNDIAPSDEDSDRRDMMVQQPHIVITGAYKDEVGREHPIAPLFAFPVNTGSGSLRGRMRRWDGPLA